MASCPSCAGPIADAQRFCPGCGAALDVSDSPTGTAPRHRTPASASPAGGSRRTPTPGGAARAALAERFAPGTVVAERYRILGLLGRGGMGEVYRADDLKLEHPVALKFLPQELEKSGERLERFFGEVRIARQVSHPAVCRVYDVGEAEGQHFLSMEFVDGENLSSLLRRIGRLPVDKALDIAKQLCAGLAAAHEKGILHRDLKPANVMLDGQGKVRITDFGLAALAETLEGEDVRSGTPSFMSPEQLLGREVTARSDIYSLGLLLYELFTGRRAFQGKTVAELTRKHRDESPVDPAVLVPDLDPSVERAILACLEKDPRRRPPSALAVSALLSGRDPLEAAIEAGETPSPELVAAAGESEGLRPAVAWTCLAVVVAGALAVPVLCRQSQVLDLVPVEKSPAVLEDRARELLGRLGHTGAADHATGLSVDEAYFRHVLSTDSSPGRWDGLRSGEPPVVQFWYRQSQQPLVPTRFGWSHVRWSDPPVLISGMAGVRYDLRGRLVALHAVPPQLEESAAPTSAAPDWSALFAEARLDPARLRPVEPRWTPPFFCDARAAWEGAWPERPEVPIRVEAAAYRGRPVWFQIVSPWTRPERQQPYVLTRGQEMGRAVLLAILVVLLVGGGVLARRNLRLGRGDRGGAFRLAFAMVVLGMAAWVVGAHHVADISGQFMLLVQGAGIVLLIAAVLWLFYLALEPYVRRLRPWTLISWARLLNGGFRDAVVGRDLLLGMVWGVLTPLVLMLLDLLVRALGQPASPPQIGHLDALLGLPRLLSLLLDLPLNAALLGLGMLLLFLVLRLLLRRDLLAATVVVGLFTINEMGQMQAPFWLELSGSLLVWGTYVALLLRFGLLAAAAAGWVMVLFVAVPHSTDLGAWRGSGTALVVPLVLLLAVYAFRTSLGGSSGVRRRLLGE